MGFEPTYTSSEALAEGWALGRTWVAGRRMESAVSTQPVSLVCHPQELPGRKGAVTLPGVTQTQEVLSRVRERGQLLLGSTVPICLSVCPWSWLGWAATPCGPADPDPALLSWHLLSAAPPPAHAAAQSPCSLAVSPPEGPAASALGAGGKGAAATQAGLWERSLELGWR